MDETIVTVTLHITAVLLSGTSGALFSSHPTNRTIEIDYLIKFQTNYSWKLQKAIV